MSDIETKIVMRPTQIFITDGKTYATMEEAEAALARRNLFPELLKQFETVPYRRTQQFRDLPFDQYRKLQGIWRITDEGPVDFGASGRPKTLAYVEGSFEQAARHALTLPDFKGYSFGHIEWIEIIRLDMAGNPKRHDFDEQV